MSDEKEKEGGRGWYPGKLASKVMARRASTNSSNHDAMAAAAAAASGSTGVSSQASGTGAGTSSRIKSDALRRRSVLTTPSSQTPEKSQSRPISKSFGDSRTPIGNIQLQIFGLKYPSPSTPIVRVELDGDIRSYEDFTEFFEENFTLFDVSSQVVITLIESYSVSGPEVVGQIVLPLSAYVGASKALPPLREHRMFFPFRSNPKSGDQVGVFRAGFEGVSGSAMTKPRQALGFVDMRLELTLIDSKMASFYKRAPMAIDYNREDLLIEADDVYMENCFNRDWKRLMNFCQLPSFLAAFGSFPECFIPIVVGFALLIFGFIAIGFKSYQLPIVLFVVVLLNGVLTKFSRNYSNVMIWNEGFAPPQSTADREKAVAVAVASADSSATASGDAVGLRKLARDYHTSVSALATALEKISNLLSFADSCMSMQVYQYLALLTFASSLIIAIFSLGFYVFLVATALSLAFVFRANLSIFVLNAINPPTAAADQASPAKFTKQQSVVRALYFFWLRAPTELDLIHRHISSLTYVKEDGAEMLDAAEAHK